MRRVGARIRGRSRELVAFKDWRSALLASQDGYAGHELTSVIAQKTGAFAHRGGPRPEYLAAAHLRGLSALGLVGVASPRVLDFGGGGGFDAIVSRKLRSGDEPAEWHIVETPEMCQFVAEEGYLGGRVTLHSSLDSVREAALDFDVLLINSSLQYTEDPIDVMRQLLALTPGRVFLTRTPESPDAKRYVTVQRSRLSSNGPGALPDGVADKEIAYPLWLLPSSDYEAVLTDCGYTVEARIREEARIFRLRGRGWVSNFGLIARKWSNS